MSKRLDLTGQRFGRWLVLSYAGGSKWACRCDCGTEKAVHGSSLRRGISNGCIKCHPAIGNRRTHGEKRTRLYTIWSRMIGRCENSNDEGFPRYGGRGIRVCAEWRQSFEAFRDWALASGYTDRLTIDRRENDGDYEPGNCRWATYTEQNRNRRDNKPIVYQGETVLISELAERHGLPADVVKNRIRRYGWPIEKALSTPVQPRVRREPWKALGISQSTYYRRKQASA